MANWIRRVVSSCFVPALCVLLSCAELKRPDPNPYLAETKPPQLQEFRWSNGPKPTSVDPAYAAAAPETDIVRALYEGLTVSDPNTLDAVPGVAEEWKIADDNLTWTFKLRTDAKWSNGRSVTAEDFIRSWQRLKKLGEKAAHSQLLNNFAEIKRPDDQTGAASTIDPSTTDPLGTARSNTAKSNESSQVRSGLYPQSDDDDFSDDGPSQKKLHNAKLDLQAPDDHTLVVKLVRPDMDLPRVVAHPVFCPVYEAGRSLHAKDLDPNVVTNGAFRVIEIEDNGITVGRSDHYWNRESVKLDRIVFVSSTKPDDALEAYRTGRVDAVTNTEFAPLAQKIFSPYMDFRKSTFAALNFYEVNHRKPPFNDRRIREALAISVEREKLTDGDIEGTTQPAFSFTPFSIRSQARIVQDKERAQDLLEQSGFPDGAGFPVIRLVVNRNDFQIRVARAVARMWKTTLNVETDIAVVEPAELREIRNAGDFDIVRRGVVLPVASEAASLAVIFGNGFSSSSSMSNFDLHPTVRRALPQPQSNSAAKGGDVDQAAVKYLESTYSEKEAIFDLYAIPIYFPLSFSLVKPYVDGFELNSLEAQSPAAISIDSSWEPTGTVRSP